MCDKRHVGNKVKSSCRIAVSNRSYDRLKTINESCSLKRDLIPLQNISVQVSFRQMRRLTLSDTIYVIFAIARIIKCERTYLSHYSVGCQMTNVRKY